MSALNVLGTALQACSFSPLTGYYRDGCCNTDEQDHGTHVVCAKVTAEFLAYSLQRGNDLVTPRPEHRFAGLRPGDAVGRYGGEEFVAIVAGAGPESARLVAERLRRSIEELPPFNPGPKRVTVSIGTAVFDPRSAEDVQSVFRRADLALYAAKRAGRNRVVMHTPECEEMLASADSSVRPSSTLARAEEAG